MNDKTPTEETPLTRRQAQVQSVWPPQFTLRFMFRAVLLVSILAAAVGGLMREGVNPGSGSFLFILALTVAAPLGVMIVLSVMRSAGTWWRRNGPQAK